MTRECVFHVVGGILKVFDDVVVVRLISGNDGKKALHIRYRFHWVDAALSVA